MDKKIFISYQREQATFADDLSDELERFGYDTWVDFKDIPLGGKWRQAIENGINESDIFLLIVSRTAIASNYVQREWQRALRLGKRIILLLFEATSIPPDLTECEWVDFRCSYYQAISQLRRLICSTTSYPTESIPQSGFLMPPTVRIVAFIVHLFGNFIVLIPLTTLFTFVPLLTVAAHSLRYDAERHFQAMIPFWVFATILYWIVYPLQRGIIAQRKYRISHMRTVFWGCSFFLVPLPLAILVLAALYSRPMKRWGKEWNIPLGTLRQIGTLREAMQKGILICLVVFTNCVSLTLGVILEIFSPLLGISFAFAGPIISVWLWHRNREKIVPYKERKLIKYYIEYAQQDSLVAGRLGGFLIEYGHTWDSPQTADVIFVLISKHNNRSGFATSASQKRIIPVLLDLPKENMGNENEMIFEYQGIDIRSQTSRRLALLACHMTLEQSLPKQLIIIPFKQNKGF